MQQRTVVPRGRLKTLAALNMNVGARHINFDASV